jgi:hypothetical protein
MLNFQWDDVNDNSRVYQKFVFRGQGPYTVVACGWGTQVETPGNPVFSTN